MNVFHFSYCLNVAFVERSIVQNRAITALSSDIYFVGIDPCDMFIGVTCD